jgi:uncharacterized membrane protein YeaQ/YmgE (transglycosylase-associated protein family)
MVVAVDIRTIILAGGYSRQWSGICYFSAGLIVHTISLGRTRPFDMFHLEDKAMHILGWIVFGLVAGAIARLLMPGRQPMGIILTIVLGIIGSFVGGVIGNAFHGAPLTEPAPSGWIGSIVGALLVLIVYSMVSNRRTTV